MNIFKKGSAFYAYRKRVARLAGGTSNMNMTRGLKPEELEERKSAPPPRFL
jgi:hypothetical protein